MNIESFGILYYLETERPLRDFYFILSFIVHALLINSVSIVTQD